MRNSDFMILNKAIGDVDRKVNSCATRDTRLAVEIDKLHAVLSELREDLNLLAQHSRVRFDTQPARPERRMLVYLDGVDVDG